MKVFIGVVVGYAVWSAVWLGANQVAFARAGEAIAAGDAFTDTGTLVAILGVSVVCSVLGGLASAKVGRARSAVIGNAVLLLLTGIFVQLSVWSQMPVWYHLAFLALLVPITLLGGRFGGARTAAA